MRLKDEIKEIEAKTGIFSVYQTTAGHAGKIKFNQKPAQQFLSGLGVSGNENAKLSRRSTNELLPLSNNPNVSIKSFSLNEGEAAAEELTITGPRINRLLKSAKTYVNNDVMSKENFSNIPNNLNPKIDDINGQYWQNLAVGICHVQEIDLFTEQEITENGIALHKPKSGIIDVDAPAVLLVSSPALNFTGQAKSLSTEEQKTFIEGMFRNLFHAVQSEGRQYIALPAAGLGAFNGDPELYFESLMKVANEFPKLNIIYNPRKEYSAQFNIALNKYNPENVVETTKDVLFLADELTKAGHPCALHNPSDADVVFGLYDVGEFWKKGHVAGEELIGMTTSAPINSRGLNSKAYSTVINCSFQDQPTIVMSKGAEERLKNVQDDYIPLTPMTHIYKQEMNNLRDGPISEFVDTINNDIDKEIRRLETDNGYLTYSSKNKIDALHDLKSRISNVIPGTTFGEIVEEWGNEKKYVNGWGQKESTATMLASHRNAFADMLSPMTGSTTKTQQFVEGLKEKYGNEPIKPAERGPELK